MPFYLVRNDITKMHADIIVNAANNQLRHGGGVCGAVFDAAGSDELSSACSDIGFCATGDAVITPAFKLSAKYIVHTVGPVWNGGNNGESELLYDCYRKSLTLAVKNDAQSIAFPLISSGTFGYPADEAVDIAIKAVSDFLLEYDMTVYLVFFGKSTFVSGKRYDEVKEYITDNYARENLIRRRSELINEPKLSGVFINGSCSCKEASASSLKDALDNLDESFSQALFRIIDEKGLNEVTVYKKANIDRKLFSKIRKDDNYKPKKSTALAFAVALELSFDETQSLLKKAGFTLSDSNKSDVIISYFLKIGNYNIFEINNALFDFDQMLLGQ